MSKVRSALVAMLWVGLLTPANGESYTPGKKVDRTFDKFAKAFLGNHCMDCHGLKDPAGSLSLQDLGPVTELNSGIWRRVWAQVTLKEMPPRDAEHP